MMSQVEQTEIRGVHSYFSWCTALALIALAYLTLQPAIAQSELDARQLIQSAMDLWRGKSSVGSMTMTIHRPNWERSMTIESHTLGLDQSFLRVTAPKKDAGNATLLLGDDMWSYSPRINRVIKIPSSMMSQSWMGSDLSNRDITKDTDIIDQYEHSLTATYTSDGHTVYQITSIPHESAAVVWGKEVHHVRDDFLILKQEFFDQDGQRDKLIETLEHDLIDGRPVATLMQVQDVDTPDEWTQMRINHVAFDIDLDPNLFSVANLRRGL